MSSGERVLSLAEAARLIYRTDAPTPVQIGRVYERIASGALQGTRHATSGQCTTTARAVADYLASQSLVQQRSRRPDGVVAGSRPGGSSRSQAEPSRQLQQVYSSVLKEYFLAVVLRRRSGRRSQWFDRAVVAGQVLLVATALTALLAAVRQGGSLLRPEQRLVEASIAEEAGEVIVTRWFEPQSAPDGQGDLWRVQFRYFASDGQAVDTDRWYRVWQGAVSRVEVD